MAEDVGVEVKSFREGMGVCVCVRVGACVCACVGALCVGACVGVCVRVYAITRIGSTQLMSDHSHLGRHAIAR